MEMVSSKLFTYFLARELIFDRPVNAQGERVSPSELSDHRQSHRFFGPACICPAIAPASRNGGTGFIETAIFVATSGPYVGQYIAACARGRCGYLGELISESLSLPLELILTCQFISKRSTTS
jgi:hypothetical protein